MKLRFIFILLLCFNVRAADEPMTNIPTDETQNVSDETIEVDAFIPDVVGEPATFYNDENTYVLMVEYELTNNLGGDPFETKKVRQLADGSFAIYDPEGPDHSITEGDVSIYKNPVLIYLVDSQGYEYCIEKVYIEKFVNSWIEIEQNGKAKEPQFRRLLKFKPDIDVDNRFRSHVGLRPVKPLKIKATPLASTRRSALAIIPDVVGEKMFRDGHEISFSLKVEYKLTHAGGNLSRKSTDVRQFSDGSFGIYEPQRIDPSIPEDNTGIDDKSFIITLVDSHGREYLSQRVAFEGNCLFMD